MSQNRELPIKVPYIRNIGEAYIDTGIIPDNNTKIIVWARNFNSRGVEYCWLFGSRAASGNSKMFTVTTGKTSTASCITLCWGDGLFKQIPNAYKYLSNYHKYEFSTNGFFVDDVLISETFSDSFTGYSSIHLIGEHWGDTHRASNGIFDICACQIYQNNNLVRDYIPINIPSIGLYDRISDTVFTNAGEGNFLYSTFDPNAYSPLEYIECSNAQYFDTEVHGSEKLSVLLGCRPIGTDVSWSTPFGTMVSGQANSYYIMQFANATYPNRYCNFYINNSTARTVYDNNNSKLTNRDLTFCASNTTAFLSENTTALKSTTYSVNAFTTPNTILVGTTNVANGPSLAATNLFRGRLYYFGMYGKRNFVPALVNNVAGMWDTYNDRFYPSVSGTEFIAGPVIYQQYYAKTDYLGFNGTQYINTLIKPLSYPNALDFKIEYRSYCPMRWGWVSQNNGSKIWIGSGDKKAYWNTYSTSQVLNNPAKSTWHTYIFDAGSGFYIDGNKEVNFTATVPSSTATSANSVPLYIGNTWDTTAQAVENYTDGYLQLVEYVKIWNDDILVRDFIPVIVNGEGYFYDRISKQLFGNSGTGSFVLPKSLDDYTQIEYLQSTNQNNNAQYITTQYIPTPNTKIILDAASNVTSGNGPFVGLYDGNSPYKRFHIGTYQNKYHFGAGTTNAGSTWINFDNPALDTARHTFVLQGNGYCSVDSTTKQLNPNNTNTYNIPIYIFRQNQTTGSVTYGYIRIWSLKIYEGDTLTMDLVPCKDSNNVGYLYDTISKQTFENAGTGSFVVGPDIT